MKKILPLLFFLLPSVAALAQVQVDVFQKSATANTAQLGVRVRSTGAPVNYIGVTFYILYQSANAAPQSTAQNSVVGVDDSKMVTTFAWGTGARFTNPQQVLATPIDPEPSGGQIYNRRFVYGNIDENGGASVQTVTAAWDTLLYITLNTLQPIYPQGGYVYLQATSEAAGAALSDENFANVPFIVPSGDEPLGLFVTPVTFARYDASCSDRGTTLSWSTAQETNSSYFEVEKNVDGTTGWTNIGRISAAGNSNRLLNYQYVDLEAGAASYRIKQVDINGRNVYTDVKRTSCESKSIDVLVYPIPARDNLTVAIRSSRAITTTLNVIDAAGRIVYRQQNVTINSGSTNVQLNLRTLPAGEYILVSSDPSVHIRQKFVIAR